MDKKIIAGMLCIPSLFSASSHAQQKESRPNLLFIMTDQQRFDALGAAGRYDFLRTPNLDRLAAEGVMFTNAYTPCAVSAPARSCILTGQMVEHTGVLTNELVAKDSPKADFTTSPTFDQLLSEAGYYSEYHGKWHAPKAWTDCYEGFMWRGKDSKSFKDQIRQVLASEKIPQGSLMDDSMFGLPYRPDPIDRRILRGYDENGQLFPEELARRKHSQPDNHGMMYIPDSLSNTAFQAKAAIAALYRAEKSGKPFNITLSINYPHAPMLPTSTYYNMYSLDDMPVPVSISDKMVDSPYTSQNGRLVLPEYSDPTLIRYMMKAYFGLVSEVDFWVGKVLDTLEDIGAADNTLVIFVSDHGEMLGAHGMREKNVFYEESARVPLIMRFPGTIKPGKVTENISTLDLFATIMDYMGIETDGRDGESLRGLIDGTEKRGDYVVTEWLYNGIRQPSHMIVDGRWKLFLNYSTESKVVPVLYNLDEDPYEMHNLIGQSEPDREKYLAKAESLKLKMIEWLRSRNSVYADRIAEVKL